MTFPKFWRFLKTLWFINLKPDQKPSHSERFLKVGDPCSSWEVWEKVEWSPKVKTKKSGWFFLFRPRVFFPRTWIVIRSADRWWYLDRLAMYRFPPEESWTLLTKSKLFLGIVSKHPKSQIHSNLKTTILSHTVLKWVKILSAQVRTESLSFWTNTNRVFFECWRKFPLPNCWSWDLFVWKEIFPGNPKRRNLLL